MANHALTTRRAAIVGAAASVAALAVPAAVAVAPIDTEARFKAAAKEFKAAAVAMDPTILTMMVSWDEGDEPGAFTRLSGVYFSRSKKMADMVDATNRKYGRT
jgi:predicted ribonuclease toxin of YeeF-YezG toxin-antitoxin module